MKKVKWIVFGFLSVLVSLYPIKYFFSAKNVGLLSSKSEELLADQFWNIGFFGHISFGGIALLIGWIQFSDKLRLKNIKLHKNIGKLYAIAVFISALCGIYIGFYATGGIITQSGFISLGLFWFTSTFLGFKHIRNGNVKSHQMFMIYSYAACFAAVTLRLWLPVLMILMDDFIPAYQIIAWLCWVPNVIVAYFIIARKSLFIG